MKKEFFELLAAQDIIRRVVSNCDEQIFAVYFCKDLMKIDKNLTKVINDMGLVCQDLNDVSMTDFFNETKKMLEIK